MRILVYAINYSPELTGIGKYTGEMVDWLTKNGFEVRVVTAPPYYPDWKVHLGYTGKRWTKQVIGNAVVFRCPIWVPKKPNGLKRIVHLASFAISSAPVILRNLFWRPDVVWTVEPTLFCSPIALIAAKLCGSRAFLHIQDLEVDAAFEMGILRGKLSRLIALWIERALMEQFTAVSTITSRMSARLILKGVDPCKVFLFPNWVEIRRLSTVSPEGRQRFRDLLRVPTSAVMALYSGNMGAKQGLELLSSAAQLCNVVESDGGKNFGSVIFVFCGNGPGREALFNSCEGLPNVRFLDLQPVERFADLLTAADIHLLPQREDVADLVMPSKLTGMLASARPVIATAKQGTELFEVVTKCGLAVLPGSALEFAGAVMELAADPIKREKLGAMGFCYALENMEKENILIRFSHRLLSAKWRDHDPDPAGAVQIRD